VGKTGVAIAIAERLRQEGEDPVAVNCDSIQVYRGLEVISGAAGEEERSRLEHRLLGVAPVNEEFSAGRYAELARNEIDALLKQGRRPIVVGGTGLYLRVALSDLALRPPVPEGIRKAVEREIAERGPKAVHGELDPDLAAGIEPRDRKRIARVLELKRAGIEPPAPGGGELWTARIRQPTLLVGLTVERGELVNRIDERVDRMATNGAAREARRAVTAGAARTARAAIGFEEFLSGDVASVKRAQLAYARRQLTWMRKMPGVRLIDRTGRADADVAAEIVARLD
jgi:tRNA dimethylallyltransferase